jgi:anti-sigma B factor antagonist
VIDHPASRSFTFAIEQNGSVAVVRCAGRLVSGTTERFYTEIKSVIPRAKTIVLDFAEVTHLDSTGIGTLVRLYVSAKTAGVALGLVNTGKSVRQLLGVTHLLTVLESIGQSNIRMG